MQRKEASPHPCPGPLKDSCTEIPFLFSTHELYFWGAAPSAGKTKGLRPNAVNSTLVG